MSFRVVIDSCGELTDEMKKSGNFVSAPLTLQVDEYIETTFEHQYMIRKKDEEAAAGLWWMRPKNSFMEDPDMGLPKYLYLPPEHLMLLK